MTKVLIGQSWRYIFLGIAVTFFGTALLTLFLLFINAPIAYTIVFAISVSVNFYFQSTFVFRSKIDRQVVLRWSTALIFQYIMGLGSLLLLLHAFSVPPELAPLVNLIVVIPFNFFTSRLAFLGPSSFKRFEIAEPIAAMVCLAIAVAVISLFTYNFYFGERIQFNDGLGWDGSAYADWAQRDSIEVLLSRAVPDYYVGRLLPSFTIHQFASLFGISLVSNVEVIRAFYIFNVMCIILSVICLVITGIRFGWRYQTTLFVLMLFSLNYATMKNMSYNPTLTDMAGLAASTCLVMLWSRRLFISFFIVSFFSCFIWPSIIYIALPMIGLWTSTNGDYHINNERQPSWILKWKWLSWLPAALIVFVTIALALYLYFFQNFRLPAGTNQVNEHLLWLSIPLLACFLFFVLRRFVDPLYYWPALAQIRIRDVVAMIALYVAVKGVVSLFSSGEPGPLTPLRYVMLIAQGGLVNPLGNLVAHLSHYGPIIAFIVLSWGAITRFVRKAGPGFTALFAIYGYLLMGTESRQFLPFLPFLAFALGAVLDDWPLTLFDSAVAGIVALAVSRFWLKINVAPWTGDFLRFPDQMLYMYSGPWMSDQMYTVFLALTAIIFGYAIMQWRILGKSRAPSTIAQKQKAIS